MKKNNITRISAFITSLIIAASFTGCGDSGASYSPSNAPEAFDNAGGNTAGASPDSSPSNYDGKYSEKSKKSDSEKNIAPTTKAETEAYEAADEEAIYESAESFDNAVNMESPAIAGEEWEMPETTVAFTEDYNTEEYSAITENEFLSAKDFPLSTFSADVDTASYTNIRRLLTDGYTVPADAVRIEEILNYFDYDYPNAAIGDPFSVTTELADCPWNENDQLLLVGIKAREEYSMGEHIPKNLVFLIDVSGSMYSADKLPLVQQAFTMLSNELNEYDSISIVTYAGSDEVLLDGESGANTQKINEVIGNLTSGGSTAGAAGIMTAYDIAEKHFIKGGNNRIILATDGDLNVGPSSVEELTSLIETEREKGIFLSVLGFGTGNYKDDRLEAIADNGNGNYSYIDSITEAKKVLIDEMDSTLITVAKDVKFQVEFNPANVAAYRLIGYENRALADRDFDDDTKDAGEVGAGSTVTVLYEIKRVGAPSDDYVPTFKYAENRENYDEANPPAETVSPEESGEFADELLTVNIRCKKPDENESKLYTYPVNVNIYNEKMPKNLNFAACCAEFGMLLRGSRYAGTSSYADIGSLLNNYDYSDDEYKTEFGYLVNVAKTR